MCKMLVFCMYLMDDPLNDIEFDTSIPIQPEGSWASENNNEKF